MRFTTNTDWTMVTSADCYRCTTKAFNMNTTTTIQNGTFFNQSTAVGDMKYSGNSYKDSVCIGAASYPCVENFEFFLINNDTAQRTELQNTGGIMGMAPDTSADGPSYLTSLLNLGFISYHQVSFRMNTMNGGQSKIVFGGVDPANMLPYPSADNATFYTYDNKYDDVEWGTEMRNMYIGDVGLDTGVEVYAVVDTLQPYIQLPEAYFTTYINYI